jgi:hypothetical protein
MSACENSAFIILLASAIILLTYLTIFTSSPHCLRNLHFAKIKRKLKDRGLNGKSIQDQFQYSTL